MVGCGNLATFRKQGDPVVQTAWRSKAGSIGKCWNRHTEPAVIANALRIPKVALATDPHGADRVEFADPVRRNLGRVRVRLADSVNHQVMLPNAAYDVTVASRNSLHLQLRPTVTQLVPVLKNERLPFIPRVACPGRLRPRTNAQSSFEWKVVSITGHVGNVP
jgi:hypothetical protein